MLQNKDISNLKGGQKRMWIEQNYELIITLHDELGFEMTCMALHMKHDTLERVLTSRPIRRHRARLDKSDRALIQVEILRTELREVKHEITQLKQDYSTFQESISQQLIDKLLKPLIQHSFTLPQELELKEQENRLRLDGFDAAEFLKSFKQKRGV